MRMYRVCVHLDKNEVKPYKIRECVPFMQYKPCCILLNGYFESKKFQRQSFKNKFSLCFLDFAWSVKVNSKVIIIIIIAILYCRYIYKHDCPVNHFSVKNTTNLFYSNVTQYDCVNAYFHCVLGQMLIKELTDWNGCLWINTITYMHCTACHCLWPLFAKGLNFCLKLSGSGSSSGEKFYAAPALAAPASTLLQYSIY
jgi:hypothetical protein